MKVDYDQDRDTVRIEFSNTPIVRSISPMSGLIIDEGCDGEVVGIELTAASRRMANPGKIDFKESDESKPS